MSDPEATQTNWRSRAAQAWGWAVAHKALTIPLAAFVLGAVVGAWMM